MTDILVNNAGIVCGGFLTEATWNAVAKDRNRVIMPASAAAAYALRILPTRVADMLLDQLGISSSMDEFQGRETKATTVKEGRS